MSVHKDPHAKHLFASASAVTNDTGAAALGFQGALNVLYDRTMVRNTTYTISATDTTGGQALSFPLLGPHL